MGTTRGLTGTLKVRGHGKGTTQQQQRARPAARHHKLKALADA
jgi:hypothetical protein